ncbi:MAG: hypothetical protein HOW73_39145 [Polyangiaceae bacterium]|nr:hypothetical protein [Polyangiaceae bacterium]
MSKVMLRLRDLDDGEGRTIEHASIDEAIAWLGQRPRFVEVLGVVFEGLSREDNDRMKAAMRPLDDDEKALVARLEEKAAKEREVRAEARRREAEEAAQKLRDEAKKAPPTRPMELRYRYDEAELSKTDHLDDRPITEEAKAAVLEWVKERQEWVEPRGQTIGEAKVTVYPGEVPPKKERVVQGTFVPITAAAKS